MAMISDVFQLSCHHTCLEISMLPLPEPNTESFWGVLQHGQLWVLITYY